MRPGDTVTDRRIPTPTLVENVVAIQRGTGDPNRVVIITGHIDSRVTDPMNATADAPGANDDGSGTAAVIEAARVLSRHRFAGTIVYAALSGEEQGLIGGKILADYARAQGWEVVANLNNDIIGNSCGSDGICDDAHVRVFSEGLRWQGGDQIRAQVRSQGGENDSPSRNLSRLLDTLADDLSLGLDVRQIWRNDRFGRGGDHTEFLNAGFPAVRFSVAVENYDCAAPGSEDRERARLWRHDRPDGLSLSAQGDAAERRGAGGAGARADAAGAGGRGGGVDRHQCSTGHRSPGAAAYIVRWRRTDAANWEHSQRVDRCERTSRDRLPIRVPPARSAELSASTLPGVRVDDWVFGVSSVAADGSESPVASAVPGGAFRPGAAARARRAGAGSDCVRHCRT